LANGGANVADNGEFYIDITNCTKSSIKWFYDAILGISPQAISAVVSVLYLLPAPHLFPVGSGFCGFFLQLKIVSANVSKINMGTCLKDLLKFLMLKLGFSFQRQFLSELVEFKLK